MPTFAHKEPQSFNSSKLTQSTFNTQHSTNPAPDLLRPGVFACDFSRVPTFSKTPPGLQAKLVVSVRLQDNQTRLSIR